MSAATRPLAAMPSHLSGTSGIRNEEVQATQTGSGAKPGTGEVPAIVREVLQSRGQSLDTHSRAFFEPRFGCDFSGVRVHADAAAATSARSIGALAYTFGSSIAFGAGLYQPATRRGQELLAHELAHVAQSRASVGLPLVIHRQDAGAPTGVSVQDHSAPAASGAATYPTGTNAWRFQIFLKPDTGPFTLNIFALTDDMIGHAWIGIKRKDGQSQTIGFWPDSWTAGVVGPGRLIWPDPHEGEYKQVHTFDQPITLDQAQKILPVIASWDHSAYSLTVRNCTDFVVAIWKAVTGETPAIGFFADIEHPLIWTPALLGEDIDMRNKVKAQAATQSK